MFMSVPLVRTCCPHEGYPHSRDDHSYIIHRTIVWPKARTPGLGKTTKEMQGSLKADLTSCSINATKWKDVARNRPRWWQRCTEGTELFETRSSAILEKLRNRKQTPGQIGRGLHPAHVASVEEMSFSTLLLGHFILVSRKLKYRDGVSTSRSVKIMQPSRFRKYGTNPSINAVRVLHGSVFTSTGSSRWATKAFYALSSVGWKGVSIITGLTNVHTSVVWHQTPGLDYTGPAPNVMWPAAQ